MTAVALSHLTRRFAWGESPPALDDVTLEVARGEFLVIVGPSGCGKTTVLRCIAGLEQPDSGEISIAGRVVNDLPPGDRDVAMVFQNYALYPHFTVFENIAFPLRMRRVSGAQLAAKVAGAAESLGISELLGRRPGQLSGGERQRVALARAMVRDPAAFLFDEPLSNLDAALRSGMRAELAALHRRLAATVLYVTHDQVEAMTLGRRIAVMKQGSIQQIGSPADLYALPANAFVARFIGSPGMNILPAGALRSAADSRGPDCGFRPEHGRFVAADSGEADLAGVVSLVEPLGAETLVHVALDNGAGVVVRLRDATPPESGARVGMAVPTERRHWFAAGGVRVP